MAPRARASLAFAALALGLFIQASALAWLAIAPEHPGEGGVAHPVHAGLRIGAATAEHGEPLRWAIHLYGGGVLATLLALLALGLGGGSAVRPRRAALSFVLAASAFIGSYLALWVAAENASATSAPAIFGLPAASAWFLLGLWPAEALFALVFVLHFRTAYWTPEAEARFAVLLAERDAATRGRRAEERA